MAKRYVLQKKCLNRQIGTNLLARNTLVQLLALYTDPESHNAQRTRQTDGQHDASSRSCCVAVRSVVIEVKGQKLRPMVRMRSVKVCKTLGRGKVFSGSRS